MNKLRYIILLFAAGCSTEPLQAKISLCDLASKATWVSLGHIESIQNSARQVNWNGRDISVTDAAFVTTEALVGAADSNVLIYGTVTPSGSCVAGQLLDSSNQGIDALFFFYEINDTPTIDTGSIQRADGGYYQFNDPFSGNDMHESISTADIASAVSFYRASGCAERWLPDGGG